MELLTVNAKGQVTIPAKVRKELDLNEGTKVSMFIEPNNRLVLATAKSIKDFYGILSTPKKSASIEEMNEAAEIEAAQRIDSI